MVPLIVYSWHSIELRIRFSVHCNIFSVIYSMAITHIYTVQYEHNRANWLETAIILMYIANYSKIIHFFIKFFVH